MKKFCFLLMAPFIVGGASAQWFPQNSGTTLDLLNICFIDNNTGYAVGGDGVILKTSDGGDNWTTQDSGTKAWLGRVYFLNADTGYVSNYNPSFLRTTDGGESWDLRVIDTNFVVSSFYFTDRLTGYVVGASDEIWYEAGGIIMKTHDGGDSWEVNYTYPHVRLTEVHFNNYNIGYVLGSWFGADPAGLILRTADGGNTWNETIIGTFSGIGSLSMPTVDTGYALTGSALISTVNGWETYKLNYLDEGFGSIYFTDAQTGYGILAQSIYGSGGMISYTNDGGMTWDVQISGLEHGPNAICFPACDTGYVAGFEGLIMKTTNGGLTGIPEGNPCQKILQINPNPAKEIIIISMPDLQGCVLVDIINCDGVIAMQAMLRDDETQLDISILPTGIYYVRVTDDRTVQVGKFIKQ